MLNKELMMMACGDSDATVVLKIQHISGDESSVTMEVQYQNPPYTWFQLLPPIPRGDTVEYTMKVPKGMGVDITGGNYDFQGVEATPNDAIVRLNSTGRFRVLKSCVVQGYVYTY